MTTASIIRSFEDRHAPAQRYLPSLVNEPHPAAADLADDFEIPQPADRWSCGRTFRKTGGITTRGRLAEVFV